MDLCQLFIKEPDSRSKVNCEKCSGENRDLPKNENAFRSLFVVSLCPVSHSAMVKDFENLSILFFVHFYSHFRVINSLATIRVLYHYVNSKQLQIHLGENLSKAMDSRDDTPML